jgi:hypothetical protein
MADPHIDRLLDRLTIEFQASVAREEGEAAADLALSLAQSSPLREQIARRPCRVLLEGRPALRIAAVGDDFLMTSGPLYLIPLGAAIVRRSEPATSSLTLGAEELDRVPDAIEGTLVELLRARNRGANPEVTATAGGAEFCGLLRLVGPDHLVILARSGDEVLISLGALSWLRFESASQDRDRQ